MNQNDALNPANTEGTPLPLPHLTSDGALVIPFASDPKYHWWKGGKGVLSVERTRAEALARVATT